MLVFSKGDGAGKVIGIPAIGMDDTTIHSYSKQAIVLVMEGWNEIPIDQWDKCSLHIKDKLESGELTLRCKKEDDGTLVQQALWEVRADYAREIVRGCYNLKNLKEWSTETKLSSELRALIDMQLTACEKGEDPKKK